MSDRRFEPNLNLVQIAMRVGISCVITAIALLAVFFAIRLLVAVV